MEVSNIMMISQCFIGNGSVWKNVNRTAALKICSILTHNKAIITYDSPSFSLYLGGGSLQYSVDWNFFICTERSASMFPLSASKWNFLLLLLSLRTIFDISISINTHYKIIVKKSPWKYEITVLFTNTAFVNKFLLELFTLSGFY